MPEAPKKQKTTAVVADFETVGSAKAKDFDDLTEYMGNEYGVKITKKVRSLDFVAVKDATSGVEWVLKNFPEAQGYLKKIDVRKGGVMQCVNDVIFCSPVTFDGNYYQGNHGFFISTGVHEATHMLEGFLISKASSGVNEFADMWNNHTVAKNIVKDAISKLPDSMTNGKKYWEICQTISPDADINSSECLAEAVADVYKNGQNASVLGKEIFNILRERTKR